MMHYAAQEEEKETKSEEAHIVECQKTIKDFDFFCDIYHCGLPWALSFTHSVFASHAWFVSCSASTGA